PGFVATLAQLDTVTAKALLFTILTAARSADSSGRRNRICWLTGRHGKPTPHLLTVKHAIWRRSFRRCW
ncbi:MAG TPA: hypothetical protein VE687_20645, partial [Stellaceae bacterium]|nr:hypothetical protein [Stellaceae bacterium]